MTADDHYVPAAGRAPLALYDPVVALVMRERTFRGRLAAQVLAGWRGDGRRPGIEVCEVGCGTGSFALTLARRPGVLRFVGVDGDPAVLERARRKAARCSALDAAGADGAGDQTVDGTGPLTWREGLADALPLEDASVDRVVMSLLLHHLAPRTQAAALAEARRVLRAGGRIHVADWGPPRDPLMRLAFRGLQLIDGVESTAPLGRGELPALLSAAGFADVRLHDRLRTGGGVLELRSARRAG